MKRTAIFFFCITMTAIGLLAWGARPAAAQQPQPTPSDDEVNRVAKQMYCPVCENIPLDVCPTQACHDWRELIRQKLAAGWNEQQIKDYFAQQYGDRVLNEPPTRGLNWLVYLLPPAAFLVGAVIVWRVLTSMRRKSITAPGAGVDPLAVQDNSPADASYLARVEEELKKKD